jgi:Tol biopolymer transport system component
LITLGAGAAAVIAGIVIGVAVVAAQGDNGERTTDQATIPFNTAAPSTPAASTSAPSPADGLPRSTPLAPTQMLIQMQTGDQHDIWVGDTTSPAPVRRLTNGRGYNGGMDISPTFDSMIYVHADDNQNTNSSLRVAGVQSLEGDRELFPRPKGCRVFNRPAWNPVDSTRLAVPCVETNNRYTIYLMTVDGTLIRRIAPPAGLPRLGDVVYSADGARLAFWAAPDADKNFDGGILYTVSVDGGTPEKLIKDDEPTSKGSDADPAYSPDGAYLAFRRRVPTKVGPDQADVYRVNVDGTGLTQLTDGPTPEQNPAWSRDSRQIAYKSGAAVEALPNSDFLTIWVMTVDGDDQRPLWTEGPVGPQALAAWAPR